MRGLLTAASFYAIVALTSPTLHAQEPSQERARDLSGVMTDLFNGNDQFVLDSSVRDKDRIELVMHRFLLGHYQDEKRDIDPDYRPKADQAAKLGIRYGAYQVLYRSKSGEDDGAVQARDFLNQLASPNHCHPGQKLLLAVDWERDKCYVGTKKVDCGIAEPSYVASFLTFVNNATHRKVLVYVGIDTLSMFASELTKEPIRGTLSRNPLWLAQYFTKYRRGATSTRVRTGFVFPQDEDIKPWDKVGWTFWQFTEGQGPPPTHATPITVKNQPVTLSWFSGSREAFRSFYDKNAIACDAIPTTPDQRITGR